MGTFSILRSSLPYRTAAVIFPFTASFLPVTRGLKPLPTYTLNGTTEVVPFHKTLNGTTEVVPFHKTRNGAAEAALFRKTRDALSNTNRSQRSAGLNHDFHRGGLGMGGQIEGLRSLGKRETMTDQPFQIHLSVHDKTHRLLLQIHRRTVRPD